MKHIILGVGLQMKDSQPNKHLDKKTKHFCCFLVLLIQCVTVAASDTHDTNIQFNWKINKAKSVGNPICCAVESDCNTDFKEHHQFLDFLSSASFTHYYANYLPSLQTL